MSTVSHRGWLSALAASLLSLTSVGCASDSLIENANVDRWCGDHPCLWEVQGRVERVGTWHSHDYAVALVSDDAAISQLNTSSSVRAASCFAFGLLARVSAGTRVYLEMDFDDDGEPEFSARLPETDYQFLEFPVRPPTWFDSVRFTLRKDGPGLAILAQLSAFQSSGCAGPRVPLLNRPSGATCERHEQCSNQRCESGECAQCVDNDECGAGQICSQTLARSEVFSLPFVYATCANPGAEVIGSPCEDDGECRSGVCCEGVCSECCPQRTACEGERTCEVGQAPQTDFVRPLNVRLPHQCAPRQGLGQRGDYCLDSLDCAGDECGADVFYACLDYACDELSCLSEACDEGVVLGSSCQ